MMDKIREEFLERNRIPDYYDDLIQYELSSSLTGIQHRGYRMVRVVIRGIEV